MDIFQVTCPGCGKVYDCDLLLFDLGVKLHCPYCGRYFYRQESPKVFVGGRGTSAVAQIRGGIRPELVYQPEEEKND